MPYIYPENRYILDGAIGRLVSKLPASDDLKNNPGLLNYAICRLLAEGFQLSSHPSYAQFNAAIGVLECVKLELYRRLAAPYEDKKKELNGDVF